jgi:hypothetical protein
MSGVRLGTCATRRAGVVRARGVEGDRRRASVERVGVESADVDGWGTTSGRMQTGRGASWVAICAVVEWWLGGGRAIFWRGAAASVVS